MNDDPLAGGSLLEAVVEAALGGAEGRAGEAVACKEEDVVAPVEAALGGADGRAGDAVGHEGEGTEDNEVAPAGAGRQRPGGQRWRSRCGEQRPRRCHTAATNGGEEGAHDVVVVKVEDAGAATGPEETCDGCECPALPLPFLLLVGARGSLSIPVVVVQVVWQVVQHCSCLGPWLGEAEWPQPKLRRHHTPIPLPVQPKAWGNSRDLSQNGTG